jgi:hypothetical protein
VQYSTTILVRVQLLLEGFPNLLWQHQQPIGAYLTPTRGAADPRMYGHKNFGSTVRGARATRLGQCH